MRLTKNAEEVVQEVNRERSQAGASAAATGPGSEMLPTYSAALRRYFRKRVPSHEVDDLVQDVFVNIQARQTVTPIENIQGYIFRVAAHVVVARHRRAGRDAIARDGFGTELDRYDITPERCLMAREGMARIITAIEALPERTRHVFVLQRFEEMTYSEIALVVGISVSAVEKHMMKALANLLRVRQEAACELANTQS